MKFPRISRERNVKSTLLVFIDGLQFEKATNEMSIFKNSENAKIIPGVGFSNNIYPEMLCGTTPDDVGYFNEWSPIEANQKRMSPLSVLDCFRDMLYINAGIRKIILKKILNRDYANIPFKYIHLFKPQGSHNFRDIRGSNLLYEYDFEIYDAVEQKLSIGKRDRHILEVLKKTMTQRNTFLSLVDLDNIAHIYGLNSDEYKEHVKFVNERLAEIFIRFKELGKDNEIFVFSDHGMVDVSEIVNLDIEAEFGKMKPDKYLYFIDSTYLRVWIKDDNLFPRLHEFLSSLNFGSLVSEKEREDFGLRNRKFGNLIFRANEGVLLIPNFHGARPIKAMHGYDSYLPSQQTIFAKISGDKSDEKMPNRSKEIFGYLKKVLEQKEE
jgi:hypothetical protein